MKLLIIALVILMAMPAQGADTQRTLSELQALLADNTTGNISPQDLRDFLVSALLKDCGYVYGAMTTPTPTTVTTAGTFVPMLGAFTNDPFTGFIFDTDHIEFTGPDSHYFEVDWHCSFTADSASTTVHIGIAFDGTLIYRETMGILAKTAGEIYQLSGTVVRELATNGEIQIQLTSDGDGDVITVNHFTTTIRCAD
jgi:hypothetical protein